MSILWGKDRHLDYWAALEADQVPDPERRAMGLLASMSDEKRFSFYCLSGMFPAMGNVTKRIYMVRRWTTVLELEDGRPRASWCILAQDRQLAPESDHVVAMKNLLEGSELHFREIGNAFHYSNDPFRGNVNPQTSFPNPYHNEIGPETGPNLRLEDTRMDSIQAPRVWVDYVPEGRVPVERIWNEDSALQFKELEGWIKTLKMKAELPSRADQGQSRRENERGAAVFRPWLFKLALLERAKDWVRIPPKERYKLPPTQFELQSERARRMMGGIGAAYGLGDSGVFSGTTNTGMFFSNNTTTVTQPIRVQYTPGVFSNVATTIA